MRAWPRVYGPRGLLQWQFVVPDAGEELVGTALRTLVDAGHPATLAVLKRMGDGRAGALSFPRAGWSLALDLPAGPELGPLLDRLDDQLAEAGGRVYLAKDSRMSRSAFERMYPEVEGWRELRRELDPRGGLRLGPGPPARAGVMRGRYWLAAPRAADGRHERDRPATWRALDLDEDAEAVLVGRDRGRLEAAAAWLAAPAAHRHPAVRRHRSAVHPARGPVGLRRGARSYLVLPAFGTLGDQARSESEVESVVPQLTVNVTSQAVALLESAWLLAAQGHGTLCVLSSIAATRSRRANFVYGSGKTAVDALGTGLSLAMEGTGVRVVVVRPGFVIGRMTAGMTPAPLASTPDDVGAAIARGIQTGRRVIWVPPTLRILAAVMRLTPYPLWRRVRRSVLLREGFHGPGGPGAAAAPGHRLRDDPRRGAGPTA